MEQGYEPTNQMVLCLSCQHEKPNVADTEIVWQWLEVENNERYWTLQGMAEYEKMYKNQYFKSYGIWELEMVKKSRRL